ncbi:head-tail connector protein [Terrihabitans sp. B22-R8]|uniref:head-tail connector protein n=1 Tax=Terrihabitans sp. B22-R8 TaxID=3425128 RepID=UPI00403C553F
MPLFLLTKPDEEPVSLDDIRGFLRLDHDDEDELLVRLIAAARRHVETATGKKLMTQIWRLVLDDWPASGLVNVPLSPLVAVRAARLRRADGTEVPLDAGGWVLDCSARLHIAGGPAVLRPFGGIEVDVEAGFGPAAAVPPDLAQAMRLLVAHWYEHRTLEPGDGSWPLAAAVLIASERRLRL